LVMVRVLSEIMMSSVISWLCSEIWVMCWCRSASCSCLVMLWG